MVISGNKYTRYHPNGRDELVETRHASSLQSTYRKLTLKKWVYIYFRKSPKNLVFNLLNQHPHLRNGRKISSPIPGT